MSARIWTGTYLLTMMECNKSADAFKNRIILSMFDVVIGNLKTKVTSWNSLVKPMANSCDCKSDNPYSEFDAIIPMQNATAIISI